MKRNLCFVLTALLAWGGLAAQAGAQGEGWYVAPKLGASILSGDDYLDANHAATGATGYDHYNELGIWDSYTGATNATRLGTSSYSKKVNKAGFAGALAIGYDFSGQGAPVRTELEFTMRAPFQTEGSGSGPLGDFTFKQKTTIQTLMFNTYLDFENDTTFTPYIGAGLGAALVKGESAYTLKNSNFSYVRDVYYPVAPSMDMEKTGTAREFIGNSRAASSSQTKLAFSLNAGGAWELNEGLSLDLGYRYFHFGNLKTGDFSRSSYAYTVDDGGGDGMPNRTGTGNDPQGKSGYKRAGLHEVMLGLRFTY